MEQYIFDKNNGLWYELQGDYESRSSLHLGISTPSSPWVKGS